MTKASCVLADYVCLGHITNELERLTADHALSNFVARCAFSFRVGA
jgi:hypothetical protein